MGSMKTTFEYIRPKNNDFWPVFNNIFVLLSKILRYLFEKN